MTCKSYDIPKTLIWEAWLQVKANQGAAGIDAETIGRFETKLAANLYKLWNRMSSGSYVPPPVKSVPIPKKSGGVRVLGIPTVSDRIAQTAVKMWLEPLLDPIFHDDSYGYRPGKSALEQCPRRAISRGGLCTPSGAEAPPWKSAIGCGALASGSMRLRSAQTR